MVKEPFVSADLSWARSANGSLIVSTGTVAGSAGGGAVASATVMPDSTDKDGLPYARWGDDNNYPVDMLEKVQRHSSIETIVEKKAKLLFGGGLCYGQMKINAETGEDEFSPLRIDEIEEWLAATDAINTYIYPAAIDYYFWGNVWAELIMNRGGNRIADINRIPATFCRWGKMQNGRPPASVFINSDWQRFGIAEAVELPAISTSYAPWEAFSDVRERKRLGKKFVYGFSQPRTNTSYYKLPSWHNVLNSKWIDLANKIPEFKLSVMQNQLSAKYILEVSNLYWQTTYPEWDTIPVEERRAKIKVLVDSVEATMTGSEKAGKTMYVPSASVGKEGDISSLIRLIPIEDKLKDGVYLEDSAEAFLHILFALDIDPSIIGNTPGKGMGAGSGSNSRVAFNTSTSTNSPDQEAIFRPLKLVSRVNKWPKNLVWRFKVPQIQTRDMGKDVKQEAS